MTADLTEAVDLVLAGWRLWLEAGRLRYRAPGASADEPTLARLRACKPDIVAALGRDPAALSVAPLSYGQRALYFLSRLEAESVAYHQSLALRVPLADAAAATARCWRHACDQLVARHPMLRMRLDWHRGEPIQRFPAPAAAHWQSSDVRDLASQAFAAAQAAAHRRPFDLERGPIARFHWFERHGEALLLVTIHHIGCDGWSMEIIRRELRALAAGAALGPSPTHDYGDFVHWQLRMLAGDRGAALWDYWRGVLIPPLPVLDLPTDRPRPAQRRHQGGTLVRTLDAAAAQNLRRLAGAGQSTLSQWLLACWCALLARWSGQDELILGMPTAGRERAEWIPIVGYFVAPVPIRVTVDPRRPFRELLAAVRAAQLGALEHCDLPFPLLVERLAIERDPARSPVFDLLYNFLRVAAGEEDLTATTPGTEAKFDLTLTVIECGADLRLHWGWNAQLFAASRIAAAADWFERLIAAVCVDPTRPVGELPLQAPGPVRPVIAGRRLPPEDLIPVHRRILAQAALTPDAPALGDAGGAAGSDAGQCLTYRELSRAIREVAAGLAARGLGAGSRIGLCLDRSAQVVVAALGVMEAGATYVALDTEHPPALLLQQLAMVGAAAVLIEPAAAGRFADTSIARLTLGELRRPVPPGAVAAADPAASADPAAVAYICFTSGSTGRPKGVAVGHAALANYVAGMLADLEIEPGSRFALVSTFAADLGNTAIFLSLASGGSLFVFPAEATTQPLRFGALMRAAAIDYLKIVPSHLAALLDPAAPALPRKGLILGGEATPRALARRLAGAGTCRLYNHYGPTEATIGCLCYRLGAAAAGAAEEVWSATLPLDRAVPDSAVLLLDRQGRAVPSGVPGEIYISGRCLAQGYVDDGGPGPFVAVPGVGRCYRSGDLARELAPGVIEILGRVDRQFNLHGYRVEPAQVEQALLDHPLVAQALVLPDPPQGASRLLAWVVPRGEAAPGLTLALQDDLAGRLPRHLLPAIIQLIARVPVTANGKVDKSRLPRPAVAVPPSRDAVGLSARDLIELRLAALWAQALGVDTVGRDADFFALGGHSLLAVSLAGRILGEFGVELPLAAFFTHRTIAAQARLLRARSAAGAAAPVPLLVPIRAGDGTPVLLLPGAGGSPVYFESLVRAISGARPVWALQSRPQEAPAVAAPDLIPWLAGCCLDELGALIAPDAGLHLVGHSFGALLAYALAVRLRAAGRSPTGLYLIDNPAPGLGWAPDYAAWGHADWLLHIGGRIARLYGVELHLTVDTLAGLDPARADARFLDALLAAGALPPDSRRDYVARFVAHYRTQAMAAAAYRPRPCTRGFPTVLFRARDQDPGLGRGPEPAAPDLGWGDWVGAPVPVVTVPGTHISMLLPPQVAELGRVLGAALEAHERESKYPS